MKPASNQLFSILSSRQFYTADLYIFTLQNGTNLFYAGGGAQSNLVYNGNTFLAGGLVGGPYFDRSSNKAKVSWKLGSGNDQLVIDVIPGNAMVGALTFLDAIRCGAFDAATFILGRAFMSSTANPIGPSPAASFNASNPDSYFTATAGLVNSFPVSYSCWFKTTHQGILLGGTLGGTSSDPSGASAFVPILYIDTNNKLTGGWNDGGIKAVESASTVTDSNWHHAVVTIASGSVVQLYLDNASQGTVGIGTPISTLTQFWIATGKDTGWPNPPTTFLTGEMADVRIYNRVLSASDIASLFNGGDVTSGQIGRFYSGISIGATLTTNGSPAFVTDGPTVFALYPASSGYGTVLPGCALIMFQGRVAEIDADRSLATFTINDYRELFSQQLPRNIFAASCANSFGDASCTVNLASFSESGAVQLGTTQTSILTTLSRASDFYDNGKITFTSGVLSGLGYGVNTWTQGSPGTIIPIEALPKNPGVGDSFTIAPGCDKTFFGGCTKYSNTPNFRGFPYVPAPETAI
jgi:Concanavalin A-like lectin/glucanases superfamily/Phage conserved hypothetical protein BR0599/Uncharacterized conserved protein (DUF2163)